MKYMGSKNRIAKEIIPIMTEVMNEDDYFVDVFCGGCNLIDKIKGRRIANDKNKYLVAMFKGLQEGRARPYTIDKSLYSMARDLYRGRDVNHLTDTKLDDFLIGWIGFMASYNGRFFDGGYSGHSVGKDKRDYIGEQIRNTESQIDSIKDVIFTNLDYKDINFKHKSCVIYCDPPYDGTKQYDTSKDFDHSHFWSWCRSLALDGHKVFVSEYNAPEDFEVVWQKEIINNLSLDKHKSTEKLFKFKNQ